MLSSNKRLVYNNFSSCKCFKSNWSQAHKKNHTILVFFEQGKEEVREVDMDKTVPSILAAK